MRPSTGYGLAAALACLSVCAPLQAHNRSVSYSDWAIDNTVLSVQLRLPGAALNALSLDPYDQATPERIAQRVRDGFTPSTEAGPCAPQSFTARFSMPLFTIDGQWRCPEPPTRVRSRFLLDAIPGHLHLLQWTRDGTVHGPFALTAAQPEVRLDTTSVQAERPDLLRYIALGSRHILGGWDHLAFLLTLVIGAATLRPLLWRITGFTVGHSVTLGLATLAGVRPSTVLVESMIALTIACTAAERVLGRQPRAGFHVAALMAVLTLAGWATGALPLALVAAMPLIALGNRPGTSLDGVRTALFGLFHGFGFAGVLAELNAQQAVPPLPLAGFNVGVEIGQLTFVIPLWWLARRWKTLGSPLVPAAALALACAWYVQRVG